MLAITASAIVDIWATFFWYVARTARSFDLGVKIVTPPDFYFMSSSTRASSISRVDFD